MSTPIQSINFEIIVSTTTYNDLNTISVVNQDPNDLYITNASNGTYIGLKEGQTLMITANTGFVLPQLILDSAGFAPINASVITT